MARGSQTAKNACRDFCNMVVTGDIMKRSFKGKLGRKFREGGEKTEWNIRK